MYRILVWGTGKWSRNLLSVLPENCLIKAFVETIPKRKSFYGHKIISLADYEGYEEETDFTILATSYYEEILSELRKRNYDIYRVFYCVDYEQPRNWVQSMCGFGPVLIEMLFSRLFWNRIKLSQTERYSIYTCDNCSLTVNNQYYLMVKELCKGKTYQQEDIVLFFELVNQYYGINQSERGYFLDVGANIGTTSIWAKKNINDNMKIIAFEPLTENCKQYRCSAILNDIPLQYVSFDDMVELNTSVLVNAALSDREENRILMLDSHNMGDNRILQGNNKEYSRETVEIKSVCLDLWVERNRINKQDIKWVWMDTQAHEAFCLSGGRAIFSEQRIPLYMEFWPSELVRNGSLGLLKEILEECYSKFICIDWYKKGDRTVYDISGLEVLVDEFSDSFTDIFLIK